MGSSALRTWWDHPDLRKQDRLATHTANDDVEPARPKSARRSGWARRLRRHYSRRSNFLGTLLPRPSPFSSSAITVRAVGPTLWGAPLAIVGGSLDSPTTTSATRLSAIGVAAIAPVANGEESAAAAAALNDNVK